MSNCMYFQSMRENLAELREQHKEINLNTEEYYEPVYCSVEKQILENKSQCSQQESYIMLEMDNCRENVKKLFTTHVKDYKPTGVTPIRKKYKYPKSVPPTICSESVLDDYRKSKTTIQEVNLTSK